ncbi:MAG: TetR/AcrR family transcriptional regulator [Solirubrobacteraceae bacterium]|nr:TetR/AcrR family transcriptional regulator [Solirubrobacteraceae bacterium]
MTTELPPPRKRLSRAERREVIELAATDVFTERGYHGAAMDEIARRSGVSTPVVYDHFASKLALHQRLLERTRDQLLEMWKKNLGGDGTLEQQIARAFTAWAGYVQSHPYAPRMFFRETTGIPEVREVHRAIAAEANIALGAILGGLARTDADPVAFAMAAEVIRGGLTELAIWWSDHPEVTAEQIVSTAMNTVWVGFERVSLGEGWTP